MRIVALSAWWPEPADNGSRLRIAHLLRALAQQHEVHLVSFAQEPVQPDQLARVERVCASVRAIPQRVWQPSRSAVLASLILPDPASVRATYSPEFAANVQAVAAAVRPDVVVAFQIGTAPYAAQVPHAPKVLEELEVLRLWEDYQRAPTGRQKARAYLTWWKHRRYLLRLLRHFDACTVVSERERALIRTFAPRALPIHVIPNGADLAGCDRAWGDPEPDTLIYPGALSYDANYDAVAHFLATSFPLIRAQRPRVRLRITGKTDAAQRAALTTDGVEWTGYVPDVRPVVARAWTEVVPLRIGGGSRLKILEALALGTPVVSTSKGIEGLDLQPERDVLVADTPDAFAAATLRLLDQPELRRRLTLAGRQAIKDKYDWQKIGVQLEGIVEAAVARRRPA